MSHGFGRGEGLVLINTRVCLGGYEVGRQSPPKLGNMNENLQTLGFS